MPMLALPPKRARPCPGGTDCGKNGFCDFRWGTCMCNFGWKGLDCGTKVAPACELNAGESYRLRTRHVTEIGFWVPASELLGPLACECYRQLEEEEEAGFTTGGGREPERVPSGQICFVRVGGGGEYDPSLQTSAFPTEQEMESSAGEGGAGSGGRDGGSPALRARFLRYGEFKDGLREASVHDYTEASEYGFAWSVRNPRPECTRVAPINECPQSCHYNGRCIDRCGQKECQCNSQTLLDNCAAPCESLARSSICVRGTGSVWPASAGVITAILGLTAPCERRTWRPRTPLGVGGERFSSTTPQLGWFTPTT